MSNPNDLQKVTTGIARASYVHLMKPRVNPQRPNDDPKYSVTLLIPKSDVQTKGYFDRAIASAIEAGRAGAWKGNAPAAPAQPVWDGDGVRKNGDPFPPECHGCWVVTASGKNKPRVVDTNRQDIIEPSEIYSGMYVRASVRFYPYANSGNKGIACGLNHVQKLGDGEPLGGMSTPEEDFSTPAPVLQSYPQAPAQQPYTPPVQPVQPIPAAPVPYAPGYVQPGVYGQQYPQAPAPGYPGATPQQPAVNPLTGQPLAPGQILGL